MPDTYLDLYKLQTTEVPYTVERIIDHTLQSTTACQLPTDNPLTLSLPTISVELPLLACQFDLNVPLIPLPYVCSPQLSGSIAVTSCNSDITITPITAISLSRVDGSECNFALAGAIELCAHTPCPDGITTVDTFTTTVTGTAVTFTDTLALAYDPSLCQLTMSGEITIDSSAIKCVGYPSSSGFTTISVAGDGHGISVAGEGTLTSDHCDMTLGGSFTITNDIKCVEYTVISDFDIIGGTGITIEDSSLTADITGCQLTLSGGPTITWTNPCTDHYVDATNVAISVGDGLTSSGNISISNGPCGATISGSPHLESTNTCPSGYTGGGTVAVTGSGGLTGSGSAVLSVNPDCTISIDGNLDLTMVHCPDGYAFAWDEELPPIEVDASGMPGSSMLHMKVTPRFTTDGDCLNIIFTAAMDIELTVTGLSHRELSVCGAGGGLENINVVTTI